MAYDLSNIAGRKVILGLSGGVDSAVAAVRLTEAGADVEALHMRFRMAVHYPDLKMMGKNSFMNIMPSPKAVGAAMESAASGK